MDEPRVQIDSRHQHWGFNRRATQSTRTVLAVVKGPLVHFLHQAALEAWGGQGGYPLEGILAKGIPHDPIG